MNGGMPVTFPLPLTKEFRIFWLDGKPIYTTAQWEEGDHEEVTPPVDQFRELAQSVQSRFFTMDVAKRLNGEWLVVELGDAQVAGLPDHADILELYRALVL